MSARPFIKWAGGKTRLIKIFSEIITEESLGVKTTYVEPFLGSGAVLLWMLDKFNFERVIVNDLNSPLIDLYNTVKYDVDKLTLKLEMIQEEYSKTENQERYYYKIRKDFNNTFPYDSDSRVKRSAFFIFLNKTSYNGIYRVNKKGEFNVPFGDNLTNICDLENLKNVSDTLSDVEIRQGSYETLLSELKNVADSSWFFYLDPPYSTRGGKNEFTSYNKQIFDWHMQEKLKATVDKISERGSGIAISNVSSECMKELYGSNKYIINEFSRNCSIGSTEDSRKTYGELVITSNLKIA